MAVRGANDRRVGLDRNLWDVVERYAVDRDITMLDAIRELVHMGLAANPKDAAVDSMRQMARLEVQRYTAARFSAMAREIADDVERTFNVNLPR